MFFEKSKKRESAFVLIGYCWEKEVSYPMEPMLYSCKALAMKGIRNLIKEIEADAAEMEYGVECEWRRDFNTLEAKYDNGIIQNWVLYERDIK